MSGCLPGEIPCGLKGSRLNRLLLPQKGGDCYTIAEQAIELYFFMFYILLLSTDQNSGGLSIINQTAPEDKVVL